MNPDRPELYNALPMPPRLIIIGDIHGDIEKLRHALTVYNVIDANDNDKWVCTPPNTIVIQLGDQVDSKMRTPFQTNETWETHPDTEVVKFMAALDHKARQGGGRVISLLGNHEIMNRMGDLSFVSEKSLESNGGVQERRRMFQPGGEMAALLSERPSIVVIGDIAFVHAGLLPHHLDAVENGGHLTQDQYISIINSTSSNIVSGLPVNTLIGNKLFAELEGIIWTRIYTSIPEDQLEPHLNNVLQRLCVNRIIVGHMVVENIAQRCNGKLWFVDCGLSRSFGDRMSAQFLDIRSKN